MFIQVILVGLYVHLCILYIYILCCIKNILPPCSISKLKYDIVYSGIFLENKNNYYSTL